MPRHLAGRMQREAGREAYMASWKKWVGARVVGEAPFGRQKYERGRHHGKPPQPPLGAAAPRPDCAVSMRGLAPLPTGGVYPRWRPQEKRVLRPAAAGGVSP